MGKSIYGVGMTYGFRHPLVRRDAGREAGTEGGIDGGEEQSSLNLLISKYII